MTIIATKVKESQKQKTKGEKELFLIGDGSFSEKEPSPIRKKEKKMNVDLLFKIAAVGILVAVLHQVLCRAGREEQAMMTTLAGLVIVLTLVIKEISSLFDTVRTLFSL